MPKRQLPRGGNSQLAVRPEVAIAAIGVFSAFADGESIDNAENYALSEMLAAIDLYADYSDDDFQNLSNELAELINAEGAEAVVQQAIETVKEEELEEVALILALVVVASDGEIPEAEADYIDSLYQALGISETRAEEIIDELFSDEDESDEDEDEEEDE